ncbi:recombinase family protein [Maricaulis sp.]|uniref:recombinase family protein n=1 Tax=Maricaulis sp. TaxID=1486257 RepID=UPI00260A055A|nr:recombinase family protein [Maricaulis sp.]
MTTEGDALNLRKAVIYVRISSKKQLEGDGIRSQERTCRDFAAYNGLEPVQVFSDVMSGRFVSRPGMDAMLDYLRTHRAENLVVLIDDVSRLSRNYLGHMQLRDEIRAAGGELLSPNMSFSDDPSKQLPEKIQAVVVEQARIENAMRSASRQRARVANGYWTFHPGPGYEFAKDKDNGGSVLVKSEPSASVIAEALNGYASGRFQTQAEVKRFLDNHPDFPKGKTGFVPKQNIRKLLTNILYSGYVAYEPWGIPPRKGHHEGLITYETHLRIKERLNGLPKFPIRKSINPDFPLRGYVDCAHCGVPLKGSWSRSRNGVRHGYYSCQTKGCVAYGKSTRKAVMEEEFEKLLGSVRPNAVLFSLATTMFEAVWERQHNDVELRASSVRKELGAVQSKIDALVSRIATAMNSSLIPLYEKELVTLNEQRLALDEKLSELTGRKSGSKLSFEEAYRTTMRFISNPLNLWRSERIECRQAAVKYTFVQHLKWCRDFGYRTANLSLPFKALSAFEGANFGQFEEMVPLA